MTKLNFYVATAFDNAPSARDAMARIRDLGHQITHDWTTEEANADKFTDDFERRAFLEECGRADYCGVMNADAVIVLAHPDMRDTRAEMGIALGRQIPVYVVDAWRAHSVFYSLVERVMSVDAAVKAAEGRLHHRTPDTDPFRLFMPYHHE